MYEDSSELNVDLLSFSELFSWFSLFFISSHFLSFQVIIIFEKKNTKSKNYEFNFIMGEIVF